MSLCAWFAIFSNSCLMLEVSGEDTMHLTLIFRPGSRWSCSLHFFRKSKSKVVLEITFFDAICFSLLMCNNSSLGVIFWGKGVRVVRYSLNFRLDIGWRGGFGGVSGMVVGSPGLDLWLVAS